jgi:diacylglycerol kinase (ATP)
MNFIISRARSFKFAFQGIWTMLKSQQNAWIHALATLAVIVSAICFNIPREEWCWLILAIVSVWTAEAFNTALEFLADATKPEYHPLIKNAKDVAAAAVLITSMGAAFVGVIILGPYFWTLLHN